MRFGALQCAMCDSLLSPTRALCRAHHLSSTVSSRLHRSSPLASAAQSFRPCPFCCSAGRSCPHLCATRSRMPIALQRQLVMPFGLRNAITHAHRTATPAGHAFWCVHCYRVCSSSCNAVESCTIMAKAWWPLEAGGPTRACSPTPLCGRKIGAFLKSSFGPEPVPIYRCGAADAQSVGRGTINVISIPRLSMTIAHDFALALTITRG